MKSRTRLTVIKRQPRPKSATFSLPRSIWRGICAPTRKPLLRQTNQKFERRFAAIERALAARGKAPQDATLAEMDALWEEAKTRE